MTANPLIETVGMAVSATAIVALWLIVLPPADAVAARQGQRHAARSPPPASPPAGIVRAPPGCVPRTELEIVGGQYAYRTLLACR